MTSRTSSPPRSRALSAAATLVLAAVTVVAVLVMAGRIPLRRPGTAPAGTVFYVVPYHYGFAFYDRGFNEVERIEVRQGETVTLHIVSASALARQTFFDYAARSIRRGVGGLGPGDPGIARKVEEDVALGNIEHIVGIAAHAVYVTTNVTAALGGERFRAGAPRTVADAARAGDPTIRSVTFTARKEGAFDVLCMDSGMDGAGTCGWAHKWMVARGAFVVRP